MTKQCSQARIKQFLNENKLHKRFFAEMIGVTLSYIYNLIDENFPFTNRAMTIERIAAVMDIQPNKFSEYIEPLKEKQYLEQAAFLKTLIAEAKLTNIEFLKRIKFSFVRKCVDILCGSDSINLNMDLFREITRALNLNSDKTFNYWQFIFEKALKRQDFDVIKNMSFFAEMLKAANRYI